MLRHPRLINGAPIEGAGHLRAAKEAGRGVIVSYCHFGPFPATSVTALELVGDVHHVVGGWLVSSRPDANTLRARRWRSIFETAGVKLVPAEGCFPIVTDLLRDNPHPTEEEIRDGLEGNLCRCTGYENIVRAVKRAAEAGVAQ